MPITKVKFKSGDKVIVVSGKHTGKTGVVKKVLRSENKLIVEGLNISKKHQKPNKEHPQGAIVEVEMPIWVSKVAMYEPTTKKASKVGYKVAKDSKARIYKSTGKEVK